MPNPFRDSLIKEWLVIFLVLSGSVPDHIVKYVDCIFIFYFLKKTKLGNTGVCHKVANHV